jgi:hypothetical protein
MLVGPRQLNLSTPERLACLHTGCQLALFVAIEMKLEMNLQAKLRSS